MMMWHECIIQCDMSVCDRHLPIFAQTGTNFRLPVVKRNKETTTYDILLVTNYPKKGHINYVCTFATSSLGFAIQSRILTLNTPSNAGQTRDLTT